MKRIVATLLAATAVAPSPAAPPLLLKAGTVVPLVTAAEVSSKTHRQGDRVPLEVSDPVLVDRHLAIPKGAPAMGEVTRHRGVGAFGREGRLEVAVLYVTVDGRQIRLAGRDSEKGRSGAVPAYTAGIVVAAAVGAMVRGKHAVIPAGTPMTGLVYRDIPLVATAR